MNAPADAPWLHRFLQVAGRGFLDAFWRFEISGLEHIPSHGGVIVAVNHRSWMDPVLAAFALYSRRYPRFVAKEELFRNPILGPVLRRTGTIALDRGRPDPRSVKNALEVLEKGGCLVLFPEGTRSRTGAPGRPKPGVGFLAHRCGVRVVPGRVWNTESFPSRKAMRLGFGPSLAYEGDGSKPSYQAFAEQVMEAVFSLQ